MHNLNIFYAESISIQGFIFGFFFLCIDLQFSRDTVTLLAQIAGKKVLFRDRIVCTLSPLTVPPGLPWEGLISAHLSHPTEAVSKPSLQLLFCTCMAGYSLHVG